MRITEHIILALGFIACCLLAISAFYSNEIWLAFLEWFAVFLENVMRFCANPLGK
jgi:hypothetical protein